jgi:hypothetical protein
LSKCKICKEVFTKTSSTQICCSYPCALKYAGTQREKKEAKEAKVERSKTKQRKEALKSLTELANDAQVVVNKYVRIRDRHLGCVSCDRPASWNGQWHASHLKSRGANSALRFHLWNLNKSCSICNNYLSGNVAEYEKRLRIKIGDEKVDFLNNHPKSRTYTREYLMRLKKIFQKKCKIIENNYK